MLLKPEAGKYYMTGVPSPIMMYIKVLKVTNGKNGRVWFIDGYHEKKTWSYLSDWSDDLKSGKIKEATVLTAMKQLGELG